MACFLRGSVSELGAQGSRMYRPGSLTSNTKTAQPWLIVLAYSDDQRLGVATTDANGTVWPKQYCSFMSDRSLLRHTLQRAARHAPPSRTLVVVAEAHERWWTTELRGLPKENIVVQPLDRGTAAGVLLPLLRVLDREQGGRVVVLPSDHHVEDEGVLEATIAEGLEDVHRDRARLTLLGITPEGADPGLEWIVPAGDPTRGATRVAHFVKNAPAETAGQLLAEGALWNSSVFCAHAGNLLDLYAIHLPDLVWALVAQHKALGAASRASIADVYRGLPSVDVSSGLLEPTTAAQAVLRVPTCGWTDLGTPNRARRCRDDRLSRRGVPWPVTLSGSSPPDIALGC